MTTLDTRPTVTEPPITEAPRTLPEQMLEWVEDARNDMTTAPTATDWTVDTAVWAARYALLCAVIAVTWPLYLPSRGARAALLLAVVLMAPAGYVAGVLMR